MIFRNEIIRKLGKSWSTKILNLYIAAIYHKNTRAFSKVQTLFACNQKICKNINNLHEGVKS